MTYQGAWRGGTDLQVGPFGQYVADPTKMLEELYRGSTKIFEQTAMWPCVVYLNQVDLKAFIETYIHPSVPADLHLVTGGRIICVPFVTRSDIEPGTAKFKQCPLVHAPSSDCVYARESEKASIRSAVNATTDRLYSHPAVYKLPEPSFIDRLAATGYTDQQIASWIRGQHGELS